MAKRTSTVQSIKVKFDPFERKMMRWLMMAASRDHTRPDLYFALTITEHTIFASDGWRLHAIPLLDAFRPFVGQTLKAARPIGEQARSMEFEIVPLEDGKGVKLGKVLPYGDPTAMMIVDTVMLKKAISGYDDDAEICLYLPDGGDPSYGRYYLEMRSRSGLGQYTLIMGKLTHMPHQEPKGYRPPDQNG
jgi:hypothetical protein